MILCRCPPEIRRAFFVLIKKSLKSILNRTFQGFFLCQCNSPAGGWGCATMALVMCLTTVVIVSIPLRGNRVAQPLPFFAPILPWVFGHEFPEIAPPNILWNSMCPNCEHAAPENAVSVADIPHIFWVFPHLAHSFRFIPRDARFRRPKISGNHPLIFGAFLPIAPVFPSPVEICIDCTTKFRPCQWFFWGFCQIFALFAFCWSFYRAYRNCFSPCAKKRTT